MKQKKNKAINESSLEEKRKAELPKEKFNTGSHTPSSMRNVGPGYDDTGKGDYAKANESENVNGQSNKKRKRKETR